MTLASVVERTHDPAGDDDPVAAVMVAADAGINGYVVVVMTVQVRLRVDGVQTVFAGLVVEHRVLFKVPVGCPHVVVRLSVIIFT